MKHTHLLPWLVIGALCAAAFYLRFVLWGYSFSALVCCCLAGIAAFYMHTQLTPDNQSPADPRNPMEFEGDDWEKIVVILCKL